MPNNESEKSINTKRYKTNDMNDNKETYYKVWDEFNRLRMVTPKLRNARAFIEEAEGVKIEFNSFKVCTSQRFFHTFRVLRVKL